MDDTLLLVLELYLRELSIRVKGVAFPVKCAFYGSFGSRLKAR